MTGDAGLVRRIGQGSSAALEKLYCRYRSDVYRLAYMMVGDAAEDITQDVFLSVALKASDFGGRGNVKAWLLTIARNKSINIIRARSRLDALDCTVAAPETAFTDIEFLDSLRCLAPETRQIVLFRVAYRLPHGDIADMLGITAAASRKRYQRALADLKKSFIGDD